MKNDKAFQHHPPIAGTTVFTGEMAMKGYALNKMCYAFNRAENRAAYLRDPEAYFVKYGLDEAQKQACRDGDILAMIAAGGNIYYLAKFAGLHGLDMQDIGAQQTGLSKEAFKEKLRKAGD